VTGLVIGQFQLVEDDVTARPVLAGLWRVRMDTNSLCDVTVTHATTATESYIQTLITTTPLCRKKNSSHPQSIAPVNSEGTPNISRFHSIVRYVEVLASEG